MQSLDYEKPPLYVAAGGGGDAIAAAMLHAARWPGIRPTIATFAWDRLMVDPIPGPRSVSDFEGLRRLDACNYAITGQTRPLPPAGSTLPRLAAEVNATFVLLDPARGAVGLREQVAALITTTGADRVEVIDVGGDILGTGTEPELKSPLADALALGATDGLAVPVKVLVAGAGLDGELTEETVTSRVQQLGGRRVMQVSSVDADWAIPLLDWHPSEATALLVAAGRGLRGSVEMRGGGHRVQLTDASPNIYAVHHAEALAINQPAQATTRTTALGAVEAAVRVICGSSEIDYERERANGLRRNSSEAASIDAAVRMVRRYEVVAQDAGIHFATFRRLAEVSGLDSAGSGKLRRRLIKASPGQYSPPLWQLSAA
jgi:hypothetical protein